MNADTMAELLGIGDEVIDIGNLSDKELRATRFVGGWTEDEEERIITEWNKRFSNFGDLEEVENYSSNLLVKLNTEVIPKYEKIFNMSLEEVILFDPLHIEQHPEEILSAIELLEECIENHRPTSDYDIQYYDSDVLY